MMENWKRNIAQQFIVTLAAGGCLTVATGLWGMGGRMERMEQAQKQTSADIARLEAAFGRLDGDVRHLSQAVAEIKGQNNARFGLSTPVPAPSGVKN